MPATDHFLVVEDDSAGGSTLERAVLPYGHVTRVNRVADAVTIARANTVWTAVLIELHLPDGNGLDVLECLAERGARVPALVGTWSSPATFAGLAGDMDVEFVRQPFDDGVVKRFVERAQAARVSRSALPVRILVAWQRRYNLTPAEEFLLRCSALDGAARRRLADEHTVRDPAVRRNLGSLLHKTKDASLEDAVLRMLEESRSA